MKLNISFPMSLNAQHFLCNSTAVYAREVITCINNLLKQELLPLIRIINFHQSDFMC